MPEKPPKNPPETGGKPLETGEKPYLQPVDMTDRRSFMEKFMVDPERTERRMKYATLAQGFRNACEEFDHEELMEYVEHADMSVQEINNMIGWLVRDTMLLKHRNERAIYWLKKITPKRIWG